MGVGRLLSLADLGNWPHKGVIQMGGSNEFVHPSTSSAGARLHEQRAGLNMLTEQEKKWLTVRKKACARCGKVPFRCSQDQRNACYRAGFPLWDKTTVTFESYRDAAEFEARVAAKLAEHAGSCGRRGGIGTLLRPHGCSWYNADGYRETVCPPGHDIDKCTGIPFCNLYLSRIAVEQEMDNERNHA